MRKLRWFPVLLLVLLFAAPAFALPGVDIAIYGQMDNTVIDQSSQRFAFEQYPNAFFEIVREESSQPIGFGLDVTVKPVPVIDIMVGANMTFANYTMDYITPEGVPFNPPADITGKEIPWGRANLDVTAIKPFKVLPMLKPYVGLGLNAGYLFPVVSDELIIEEVPDPEQEPDLVELARSLPIYLGYHVTAGLQFKAPIVPGVRVFGKYYGILGDPGKDVPTGFLTLGAGVVF